MEKVITIKIQGNGTGLQSKYVGDDAEKDYFDAIKKAAETLETEKLHYAEVCLFDSENDTYDKAVKKFEIMRH